MAPFIRRKQKNQSIATLFISAVVLLLMTRAETSLIVFTDTQQQGVTASQRHTCIVDSMSQWTVGKMESWGLAVYNTVYKRTLVNMKYYYPSLPGWRMLNNLKIQQGVLCISKRLICYNWEYTSPPHFVCFASRILLLFLLTHLKGSATLTVT